MRNSMRDDPHKKSWLITTTIVDGLIVIEEEDDVIINYLNHLLLWLVWVFCVQNYKI